MRYGSVCSGIEAASAAWHPLGWTPAWFSEIEPFPCAVLKHHYPTVPNRGDMTKFKDWPDDPIDVLVGGTPCQSFSVAGLRKGLDDPRGNLMLTFLAIADRFRPRWLVWENVPGVLSSGEGRDFGCFLGGLGELGYGFAYRILDAQYHGLAQRRRRVFVVGYLGDWRRAAAVLFERSCLQGDPPPGREKGKRVAGTIKGGSGSRGYPDPSDGNGGGLIGPVDVELANTLRGEGYDAGEDGTGRGTPLVPIAFSSKDHGADAGQVSPTLRSMNSVHSNQNGGGQIAVAFTQSQTGDVLHGDKCAAKGTNQNATGRNTPKVNQGMSVRRLTPRECERLQGFKDDHTLVPYRGKPACDGPRYKALGNSMAVPCMVWLGKRIQMVEDITNASKH